MAGNKLTFLFIDNDKIDVNKTSVNFIFGEKPAVVLPSCPDRSLIDPLKTTFDFTCSCNYIDPTNGSFTQPCGATNNQSSFGTINSYQGYSSDVLFSYVINDVITNYGSQSDSAIVAADMRFPHDYNYGFTSDSVVYKSTNLDSDMTYGSQSDVFVLYNPYNQLSLDNIDNLYGQQSDVFVLYNPYNELLVSGITTDSLYGQQSDVFLLYNPYTLLLVSGVTADSLYGQQVNTLMTFKQWENLVPDYQTIDAQYGQQSDSWIQYNPYTELLVSGITTDALYGASADSTMRYSDDPYINNIEFYNMHSSDGDIQISVGQFVFAADAFQGFSTDGVLEYTLGLAATAYQGMNSDLLFIMTGRQSATFIASSYVGHSLLNIYHPFNIDLNNNACCVYVKDDLRHIEMLDEPKYNRDYTDVDMIGMRVDAVLTAQPRFSPTASYGTESKIIDPTVYLNGFEFHHGVSANVRTMTIETSFDLTVGNFLVDQNEIKVELTKPDDIVVDDYTFTQGMTSKVDLGIIQNMASDYTYGYYTDFSLTFDSPMRPDFFYGAQSYFTLATQTIINTDMTFGWQSNGGFYEPPIDGQFGWTAECSDISADYLVELLEEGELHNNYLFQTPNGDIDKSKPNGESLEGYEYTHYVQGRCY